MTTLRRVNDKITGAFLALSGLAVVAMTLLLVTNMVVRATHSSIFGTVEMVGWLAMAVNGLGLAYSQRKREHVAITLFTDRLPVRWRAAFDALGVLLGLVFVLTIIWGLWQYADALRISGSASTSLEISYWWLVVVLVVGFVGFLSVLVEDLITTTRTALFGPLPETSIEIRTQGEIPA